MRRTHACLRAHKRIASHRAVGVEHVGQSVAEGEEHELVSAPRARERVIQRQPRAVCEGMYCGLDPAAREREFSRKGRITGSIHTTGYRHAFVDKAVRFGKGEVLVASFGIISLST